MGRWPEPPLWGANPLLLLSLSLSLVLGTWSLWLWLWLLWLLWLLLLLFVVVVGGAAAAVVVLTVRLLPSQRPFTPHSLDWTCNLEFRHMWRYSIPNTTIWFTSSRFRAKNSHKCATAIHEQGVVYPLCCDSYSGMDDHIHPYTMFRPYHICSKHFFVQNRAADCSPSWPVAAACWVSGSRDPPRSSEAGPRHATTEQCQNPTTVLGKL